MFYAELWDQHDRVDLFVKSKADEYSRRLRQWHSPRLKCNCTNVFLGEYQKKVINLIARNSFDPRRGISAKRREKLSRLENKILRQASGFTINPKQDANYRSAVVTTSRTSSVLLMHNE